MVWLLWTIVVLIICLQQSVLLFDKHGVQFPLARVGAFVSLYWILYCYYLWHHSGFDFNEMLVRGFFKMCSLKLDLLSTGVSAVEVCFSCLEVSCYKGLIMEDMTLFTLFCSTRRTLLSNFKTFLIFFSITVFSYPHFTNWSLVLS